jgi:SAM-dependent methyltransferase
MRESDKSKRMWKKDGIEFSALKGKGIDIGCADCPIMPNVRCFDMKDGDANFITKYVKEQFDFVYSSHCLEHMHDPEKVVLEWWKLVKAGGYPFFTVPDEDLYEQGIFPSASNPDHKHTFTISKSKSWSPLSVNVYDLARSLPNGEIASMVLQDDNYDRSMMSFGTKFNNNFLTRFFARAYFFLRRKSGVRIKLYEKFIQLYQPIDQLNNDDTLAQIQCIVKKTK